jgi:dynein heavy chain, axonemal
LQVLRQNITDLQDYLPLFQQLSKPSIKPRHWAQIIQITGTQFPYDKESFRLETIMQSTILQFKGEVEEICEGADKQLEIETKFLQIIDQ